MTKQMPVVSGTAPRPVRRFVIRDFVICYLMLASCSLALMVPCYLVAGNSLNLFIAGFFVAALLLPHCSATAGQSPGLWSACCMGIGSLWLIPVFSRFVTFGQWASCMAILISFAALLNEVVKLLLRCRVGLTVGPVLVELTALAWLTWPVWLSGSLTGQQLHWSVLFHPLFAINHVVSNLGIWTEQQGAYALTNLGQDVQYQLPASAWPVIGLQTGLAIFSFAVRRFLGVPTAASAASPDGR